MNLNLIRHTLRRAFSADKPTMILAPLHPLFPELTLR
jgi:hypothetical protein